MPTRGIERWLTQRMSAGLGRVAGPRRRRVRERRLPAARAADRRRGGDGLRHRPRRRPVAGRSARCGRCWRSSTRRWASRGSRRWPTTSATRPTRRAAARRFTSVRHLAELYDRYALYRPEMLEAVGGRRGRRLAGRAVAAPARAAAGARSGRARRHGVRARCARTRALVDLPPRLALFGLTRLPAGHLNVLRALAAAPRRPPVPAAPVARAVGAAARAPARSCAVATSDRDGGEPAARRPGATTRASSSSCSAATTRDHLHAVEHGAATACSRACSRTCARTAATPTQPDRSIQVHSCHGRARQVEVLRDAILHLLAERPDARAARRDRDVPRHRDVRAADPGDVRRRRRRGRRRSRARRRDLRVRLADRSLRQTNPLLGVVARLLELAGERLTASQVLDLADREPVRRRFGLDDDDIARLEEWVRASGIRWGLDAEHRAPFKLGTLPSGTWRAGLDRLLLGVTMSEDGQRLFERVLPLDDVESGAIDLVGRFAELIDRAAGGGRRARAHAADRRRGRRRSPRPPTRSPRTAPRDAWQRAELQRLLDDVVGEAAGSATELALPELRTLLADRLQGRPTRANFRTGHLTICTLVPMRSVPHRVVCLLGIDDGVFPRKAPRDGDDLLLDDPHVGERDAAHRGPPAAARRADGRDRPADRHLHRQRRAHEPRPPAGGAGRRAARPRRPRRRRPPPAAAVRPAQLRAGSARAGRAVELRPR